MQRLGRALGVAADLLFTLLLLAGLGLIVLRAAGFKLLAVETGSMGEDYPVGSLLLVRSCAAEDIRVGDVISFVANEELTTVTHRVTELGEGRFYTKGDANNAPDPTPVAFENLIGRVELAIPKLGYTVIFAHTTVGKAVIAALLVLIILPAVGLPQFKRSVAHEHKQHKEADEA